MASGPSATKLKPSLAIALPIAAVEEQKLRSADTNFIVIWKTKFHGSVAMPERQRGTQSAPFTADIGTIGAVVVADDR